MSTFFVPPDSSAFDNKNKITENEKNTSNLITNIEPILNEDENPVYILEKDTYLYHANNRLYDELSHVDVPMSNINDKFNSIFDVNNSQTRYLVQPLYFSNSLANIEEYGCRFEFKTKKQLKLLAVDALTVSSPFYRDASNNIQDILRENYGVKNSSTERRIRNSVKHKDDEFVKYLCDNFKETFDGYMTKQMQLVEESSSFHPEIVLCDVKECVELNSQMDNDKYCQDKYIERKLKQETRPEKKIKSVFSHVKPVASLSFDSPSSPRIDNSIFSSPYSSPTKKHRDGTKRDGTKRDGTNRDGTKGGKTKRIRNKKQKINKSKSSKKTRKSRKSNK